MTLDEIYEQTTKESLTWKEVIEILYNNIYYEGYAKAVEDINVSAVTDATEVGNSKIIGVELLKLIGTDLVKKVAKERGRTNAG